MRIYIVIVCALLSWSDLLSQEQLGMRLENYAGVSSLALNPANNLTNPLNWDINLASAAVFLDNNYAFFRNTNTIDFLKNVSKYDFFSAPNVEGQTPKNAFVVDYFNDKHKRFGIGLINIMGPSVVFRLKEIHSVGFFINYRAIISTQAFSNDFSFYNYNQPGGLPPFTLNPFEGALISWREYGVNYAVELPTLQGSLGLGISLRYLEGFESAFFQNSVSHQHQKFNRFSFTSDRVNVGFGFTTSNLNKDNFNLQKNGSGFAVDLGATYIIFGDRDNYLLKLGASILDLGSIRFKKNVQSHAIRVDSTALVEGTSYEHLNSLDDLPEAAKIFSFQTLGDSTASLQQGGFKVLLPTALSLQGDYSFSDNFYLNATLVQRIPMAGVAAERGNLFALTPRFEHRWFAASLPFVLYNWQDFRMGAAVRLAFLVVGSDNIGSFFGHSDLAGTDLYAALKINPFDLGIHIGRKNKHYDGGKEPAHRKRKRKTRCYDF